METNLLASETRAEMVEGNYWPRSPYAMPLLPLLYVKVNTKPNPDGYSAVT